MTITTLSLVDATDMEALYRYAIEMEARYATETEALWAAAAAAREAEAIVVASADATDATKMAARLAASAAWLAETEAELAVLKAGQAHFEERTARWAAKDALVAKDAMLVD